MPSWPPRLPPNASISERSLSKRPGNNQIPGHEPDNLYAGPSQRQTNALLDRLPALNGAHHGRSISHPSPLVFNNNRRLEHRRGEGSQDATGLEVPGHEIFDAVDSHRSKSPMRGGRPSQAPAAQELITGKCKTCDSLVRWPNNIKVFRCTICLMINDLEPFVESGAGKGQATTTGDLNVPRPAPPISLEKTRAIVDRCISSYLEFRREHPLKHDGTSDGAPYSPREFQPTHNALNDELRNISQPISHARNPSATGAGEAIEPAAEWPPRQDQSRLPAPIPNFSMNFSSTSLAPPAPPMRRGSEGSPITPALSTKPLPDIPLPDIPPPTRPAPTIEPPTRPAPTIEDATQKSRSELRAPIFRPLENYIASCFQSCDSLNISFATRKPTQPRAANDGAPLDPRLKSYEPIGQNENNDISELDAKLLLVGDFAENGTWWLGGRPEANRYKKEQPSQGASTESPPRSNLVSIKTPRIQWAELAEWYHTVIHAGDSWRSKWDDMNSSKTGKAPASEAASGYSNNLHDLEKEIMESQVHLQRALLKATENLLKRPKRPLQQPQDSRFLLIILANPLIYPPPVPKGTQTVRRAHSETKKLPEAPGHRSRIPDRQNSAPSRRPPNEAMSGQHSGIIKRIVGLLSNLPTECHQFLVSWFSRLSQSHFQRIVDLLGKFVSYRLSRQHGRRHNDSQDITADLIPNLSDTSAQLHATIGQSAPSKKQDTKPKSIRYEEDWQIKAAAKVISLLFLANNSASARKRDLLRGTSDAPVRPSNDPSSRSFSGQLVPVSAFYNTMLDFSDLVADFETWESRPSKFSFCKYPFFLSIWAKTRIMEHDAKRQMADRAREAFFNSLMGRHEDPNRYLELKVRRECLVEDSLRTVSEVVGAGQEEIKKGLKIEFVGEEGIDAGGLRKEWFLLLVREVFDPNHGLFIYDDDSQFCYFNPHCFETSDQFFLVGVLLGLAIYNSTILDVALPPFAFRKLLAAAPANSACNNPLTRPSQGYSLDDLEQLHPLLARGLRQLLEYDGDVEETFCRDFVAEVDRYGQIVQVPLCPEGEKRPVTNANRREFVELYIKYLLETAVSRQFEPFKRGFFTVCGGNALSLFRPEEIELLVRGSDEPLDVSCLRNAAKYENWGKSPPDRMPAVCWFWDFVARITPGDQRKILTFITGSDRIPAMGAGFLVIKVMCIGEDCERFPTARTCFNTIGLYKYGSREKLESKLWRAVSESEGFGLK
ncbi:MAG: putative E3 ubiquitin-protein ligase [Cirrosporium novae-zelandiae]|nr:MAG: putative E3 ubiquitin-protein ligase [Cirrosporium novae-zelandiae]